MSLIIEIVKVLGVAIFVFLGLFAGFLLGFGIWIKKKINTKPYNRLSHKAAKWYEKMGYLIISPNGDSQDFIFGEPESNQHCGNAYMGMTLDAYNYSEKYKGKIYDHFYGGVIGLNDCIKLRDHLNKHIEKMLKLPNETKPSPVQGYSPAQIT